MMAVRLYLRLFGSATRTRMQYKPVFLLTSLLFGLVRSIDFLAVAATVVH